MHPQELINNVVGHLKNMPGPYQLNMVLIQGWLDDLVAEYNKLQDNFAPIRKQNEEFNEKYGDLMIRYEKLEEQNKKLQRKNNSGV